MHIAMVLRCSWFSNAHRAVAGRLAVIGIGAPGLASASSPGYHLGACKIRCDESTNSHTNAFATKHVRGLHPMGMNHHA